MTSFPCPPGPCCHLCRRAWWCLFTRSGTASLLPSSFTLKFKHHLNHKCKKIIWERSCSFMSRVCWWSCPVYPLLFFRWSSQCQATVWSTQRMWLARGTRIDWDRTALAHADSESLHWNSMSQAAIAPYCLTLGMSPIAYTLMMRTRRTLGCPHLHAELAWRCLLTWTRPVMQQSVSEKSWSVTHSDYDRTSYRVAGRFCFITMLDLQTWITLRLFHHSFESNRVIYEKTHTDLVQFHFHCI